jgi:predicted transcriptional regulator
VGYAFVDVWSRDVPTSASALRAGGSLSRFGAASEGTEIPWISLGRRLGLPYCRLIPMSTTVRVSEETRRRAAALAKATGRQLQQVIEEAVTAYERELFWQQLTEGYETLADNEKAWAEVQAERATESGSLADDLRGDPTPR